MKSEKWRYGSQNSPDYIEIVGRNLASACDRQEAADQALRGNSEQLFNLPSDYSVIVDQDGKQIVSCGPSGQFPIYWRQAPGDRVDFSTDMQPTGHKIDPTFLGASIIRAAELQYGRTVFEGVNKVEGGEITIFRHGRPIETRNYISPDSRISLEDAADEFRQVLIEAIEFRVKLGKVATSDLSGGFDSTALAILLADRMDRGIDTFIQYRPGSFSGDLIFARQIAAANSAIRLHELEDDEKTLPFQGLGTERAHDEPNPWTIILKSILARLAIAQSFGSQLHLTGEGGDVLLSPSWSYLIDMVREGVTEEFDKLATTYARMRYLSPARFKEFIITQSRRTLADDLIGLAEQLHQQSTDHANLIWISNPGRAPYLLRPSMRQQLAEQATAKALEVKKTLDDTPRAGDYRSISGLRESGHGERRFQRYSGNYLCRSMASYDGENMTSTSPEKAPCSWHIPEYIHPLVHDGGIVYFNSHAGRWGTMNRRTGIALLRACGALESLNLAWRELP